VLTGRRGLLVLAIVFGLAVALGASLTRLAGLGPGAPVPEVPRAARLPSLDEAGPWVRGRWTADSLRGHVTVVMLWSDTDPLALASLPDAEAWNLAYRRYGLRVLGVHVPEFAFAADTGVAAQCARRLSLTFPIVGDPAYKLSSQFPRTAERPSFYVADTSGRVVFEAGGPRAADVDRALRRALAAVHPEAGIPLDSASSAPDPAAEVPAAARVVNLGASRAEREPLAGAAPGRPQWFTAQFRFQEEGREFVPCAVGRWTPEAEGLVAARGGPENFVSIRGQGRAWAVLAPPPGGRARVWVLGGDRWLPRERAGADVEFDARGASFVDVRAPRLYSIASCPPGWVLKLSPEAAGTAFYSFAFEPDTLR